MVDRRLKSPPSAAPESSTQPQAETSSTLIEVFRSLWSQTRCAFKQERTFLRAGRLARSVLLSRGRHTITGLITTAGDARQDWSADYRLFERGRIKIESLWTPTRQAVEASLPAQTPLVVSLDDFLLRKWGRKIPGASWWRDPLGPAFHTNFIWGQRFFQISATLPEKPHGSCRARAIPLDLQPCPTPPKPKKNASEEQRETYRQQCQACRVSVQGAQRLAPLRRQLDRDPGGRLRLLIACVDGGFTNSTVLKKLPERTVLIGRIRRDAKLYARPGEKARKGTCYGERLPTPEPIRADESVPRQTVRVSAAGELREFRVKTVAPVRWRTAGGQMNLRLLVIAPVPYRLSRRSRRLYRQPVDLICTDVNLSLEEFLQNFVWRWEIEVNFRDEKTLLGLEEPQVWTPKAMETVSAFFVTVYALLLLAGHRTAGLWARLEESLPKWRKSPSVQETKPRLSTQDRIALLRDEVWGLGMSQAKSSGFDASDTQGTKPEDFHHSLHSAAFYASG